MKPSFFYIVKSRLKRRDFLYEFYFKGRKTLDLGCGAGEFLRNDPNIIGVESNARLAQRPQVVLGNATKLPFEDQTFDAIHCRNVIEHLEVDEAYQMIKEGIRVLKPGGIFMIASETVTKKFWGTFGHTKPYPPGAIIKLIREENREEFEGLTSLEHLATFYLGNYSKYKLVYLLKGFLGYYLPALFAREYFTFLIKKQA